MSPPYIILAVIGSFIAWIVYCCISGEDPTENSTTEQKHNSTGETPSPPKEQTNPLTTIIALLCLGIGTLGTFVIIAAIGIFGLFLALVALSYSIDVLSLDGGGWIFGIPLLILSIILIIIVTYPDGD